MTQGTMDIKLDPAAAASIASAAILQSLSDEHKQLVLEQAVKHLIEPTKGDRYTHGVGKTPLQIAFDQALTTAARDAVKEVIENDATLKQAIDDMLQPMILTALDGEAKNYDSTLADKIGWAIGQYLAECAQERNRSR